MRFQRGFAIVFVLGLLLPGSVWSNCLDGPERVESEILIDPRFKPEQKLHQGPWNTCYGFAATYLLEYFYNSVQENEMPIGISPLSVLGWGCGLNLQKAVQGGAPHLALFKIRERALDHLTTHAELPYQLLYELDAQDNFKRFQVLEAGVKKRLKVPPFNIVFENFSAGEQERARQYFVSQLKEAQTPVLYPIAFSQEKPSHSRVVTGYRKHCCGQTCKEQLDISNWHEPGMDEGWTDLNQLNHLAEVVSIHRCSAKSDHPELPACNPLFLSSNPFIPMMDLDQAYEEMMLKELPAVLASGASLVAVGPLGYTPLLAAAHHGSTRVVNWMVEALRNLQIPREQGLDARNARGLTALAMAVYLMHEDTVVELLKAGANPCAVANDGSSILDLAQHPYPRALAENGDLKAGKRRQKFIISELQSVIRGLRRDVVASKIVGKALTANHKACSSLSWKD